MKFVVVIERDEDGMYIVECPSVPGCVSKEAIKACLEVRAEKGMPLTVDVKEIEIAI